MKQQLANKMHAKLETLSKSLILIEQCLEHSGVSKRPENAIIIKLYRESYVDSVRKSKRIKLRPSSLNWQSALIGGEQIT